MLAAATSEADVAGLSLGGLTTVLVTYHPALRDPRIKAALPIAPGSCIVGASQYATSKPELLVLHGDQDLLVPIETNGRRTFARAASRRRLVTLRDGSHAAFASAIVFPSATSYDLTLGCPAVAGRIEAGALLDGLGPGVDVAGCALPCAGPPPAPPVMQALRQHELTPAIVSAFFTSTLQRSRAARCFLGDRLDAENDDVTVEVRAKGR